MEEKKEGKGLGEGRPEAQYLATLGIGEKKAAELLKNKRVRTVAQHLEAAERKAGKELSEAQKKLFYKVLETATGREDAWLYANLVLGGSVKNEADLKNAASIVGHNPRIMEDGAEGLAEVRALMEKNIPGQDELTELTAEIVRENQGQPRAKLLKELKHHPRLQFVPSKEILELLETLSLESTPDLSTKGGEAKATISDLLEMACSPTPPTRTINRLYREVAVPAALLDSKEKKWTRFTEGEMQDMHCPLTNYQKTAEMLREHIKRTKGQVRVRFPPEPNGHLHIGHAKAMSINFGYRDFYKGWISLRYDDTNPKAEKPEFYEKILEMVRWMGFEPDAITYASDYFPRLYECAVELVRRGKAYVCHAKREEVSAQRKHAMEGKIGDSGEAVSSSGERVESPWRNRPVEDSLREFERMKRGEYAEGEAVLRMKMDMTSDNPQLWDLVAYRVLKHPHPRTGTEWVIYPSYDFTHCLTDSFEDITHSFCTTEFINSRESYNWLCDALDLYRPVQWEYSRLCMTDALLSKRYITRAIGEGKFSGWDDPRLCTLEGLRSRGIPPFSIRTFVESLGITTAGSEIPRVRLDNIVREDLKWSNTSAAVLDEMKLNLIDADTRGILRTVLVDRSDYNGGEPDPSFYRLQRGATVALIGIGPVDFVEEKGGELFASASSRPPKAALQWTELDAPVATVETFSGSEILTYASARVSPEAARAEPGTYWQFLRIGFFLLAEKDPVHSKPTFRLVVPLRQ